MSFKFPDDFEDAVTEVVAQTFFDLPADAVKEPTHMTNKRLPELANALGEMARMWGCMVQFSTPMLVDTWTEGGAEPSRYSVKATWHGVAGKPAFEVPILPRDAA